MDVVQVETRTRLPAFQLTETVVARSLFGQHLMFNFLDFEPQGIVPLHDHPHEQLGLVLSGELLMVCGGVEHVLRENSVYAIPGGIPHSGYAGADGCQVLDVFHPIREDYRARVQGRT
jgi:quercetin dioxygenase-like cupin family protein